MGDTDLGVDVVIGKEAAFTEVVCGVAARVDRVAGPAQSVTTAGPAQSDMMTGNLAGIGVGNGRLPGYLQGVDLAVLPSSMWMAAGVDEYHLVHCKVYDQ